MPSEKNATQPDFVVIRKDCDHFLAGLSKMFPGKVRLSILVDQPESDSLFLYGNHELGDAAFVLLKALVHPPKERLADVK